MPHNGTLNVASLTRGGYGGTGLSSSNAITNGTLVIEGDTSTTTTSGGTALANGASNLGGFDKVNVSGGSLNTYHNTPNYSGTSSIVSHRHRG